MTAFEKAKRSAKAEHAAWSAAQRARWAGDSEALREAIRTRAVDNLTPEDRDALIDALGRPRRTKLGPAQRKPLPIEPATKPASPRQNASPGEFARALEQSLILGLLLPLIALFALEILWSRSHG